MVWTVGTRPGRAGDVGGAAAQTDQLGREGGGGGVLLVKEKRGGSGRGELHLRETGEAGC